MSAYESYLLNRFNSEVSGDPDDIKVAIVEAVRELIDGHPNVLIRELKDLVAELRRAEELE